MSLLKSISKLGAGLKQHQPLIAAGISPEFITSVKQGYVLVPEQVIRLAIKNEIEKEKGVALDSLSCSSGGIRIDIRVQKGGVDLTVQMSVKLTRIVLNGQKQEVEFSIKTNNPVSNNLCGRLVSAVGGTFLSGIISKKISNNQLVATSNIVQGCGDATLDISTLEQLQPLMKTIPFLNKSALDMISFQEIEHIDEGIRVKAGISV